MGNLKTRKKKIKSSTLGRKHKALLFRILGKIWLWITSRSWWQKILLVIMAFLLLLIGVMYSIAQWYIFSQRNKPYQFGVTFIPSYAEYLGVDPDETLNAILNDLGAKRVRLASYWDKIQPTQNGPYDFRELDKDFSMIQAAGAKVTLAIGLRQPRWPECHMPDWAMSQPKSVWYPELKQFMQAVVEHYKNQPALISYQLENEYLLKVFGKCTDFSRDRLIDEFNFVKSLDSNHPIIVSRSNNWVGLPIGQPRPDEFGISVYKRVWDRTITKRYVEYPYPAWYYGFYAGAGKLLTGKDLMIHELQAEPWMPDGIEMPKSTTAEQYQSMSPQRLKDRFEYARATGMHTIDFWGVEWWYWRKVHFNDPEIWNIAKTEFDKANSSTR